MIRNCCVCLEDVEYNGYNSSNQYDCDTCKDGFVCGNCMGTVMENDCGGVEYAFIFEGKELKRRLSCPCCRSVNWKCLYSSLMDYLVEGITFNEDDNPALDIFWENLTKKEREDRIQKMKDEGDYIGKE